MANTKDDEAAILADLRDMAELGLLVLTRDGRVVLTEAGVQIANAITAETGN